MFDLDRFRMTFETMLRLYFTKTIETSDNQEKYEALSHTIMSMLADDWSATNALFDDKRKAYYFSAEFLIGRSLGNNMLNIGYFSQIKEFVESLGLNLNQLEEKEEDAALGNGGLGRLAACFMESATTLSLPLYGYGVLYNQGLFKQRFIDGFQTEEGDEWIKDNNPWILRKESEAKMIHFREQMIKAVPYDMPILGYDTCNVNTLRLWQAESVNPFDFNLFNNFEYDRAVMDKNRSEDISRVLYPNDMQRPGKVLRLKQQYFFVSASLQDIIVKYKKNHGDDFSRFAELHIFQLNDTHPVIAIPELMRLLMDQEGLEWGQAWDITKQVFAFTNHTILSEAMECWCLDVVEEVSPRILSIIREINRRFTDNLRILDYSSEKIEAMKIMTNDTVCMTFLALHTAIAVNGVAALHTEILKADVFKDWYKLYPEKFQNKTNGITPRRWLMLSNPELTAFITKHLGHQEWVKDLSRLKELEQFLDNDTVLMELMDIKREKKRQLAEYIESVEGIKLNPDSIFNIQIKRIHEYKRQLLNALHIIDLYYRLKEDPDLDICPHTFIFGGKAAPGYFRAKGIIKFINEIANMINQDKTIQDKLKVVFVENYRVSYAQKLFPAADISEQISTAGKEASGTGNMKFMLNATPTLGTFDGANVEIVEEAGEEANFIFGARVEELMDIAQSYNPKEYYHKDQEIRRAVDSLLNGILKDNDSYMFLDIYNALVDPKDGSRGDQYYILKDFQSYKDAHKKVDLAYRDPLGWAKRCLKNLANSGKFSSDRTIADYNNHIWNLEPTPLRDNGEATW